MPQPQQYPHPDGDVTVLGPEVFASADHEVICWRGENYVRQTTPSPDFTSPIAGRIEVRQPCPYCGDRQMIPTSQYAEHIARVHPDENAEAEPQSRRPMTDTPPPQAVDYSGQPLAEGDTVAFIGTDPVCLRQGRIRAIGPNDLCIEAGAQLVLFNGVHAGWAETPAKPLGGTAVPDKELTHVRAYPHVALHAAQGGA